MSEYTNWMDDGELNVSNPNGCYFTASTPPYRKTKEDRQIRDHPSEERIAELAARARAGKPLFDDKPLPG